MDQGCYTDFGVSGYGVAVKLSRRALIDNDAVQAMAEETMLSIARKCLELGARAIGHIKSFIRTDYGTIKADTIGIGHGAYSSGNIDRPVKVLYMAVNAVVPGIPEAAVKAATLEGIYLVADRYGFCVFKEKEHAYFDEFDAQVVETEMEIPVFERRAGHDP